MRIKLADNCRKHYYIYQDGKKVGRVKKRSKEFTCNNNSPVLIRRTTLVREIIYYSIVGALFITCMVFARPVAALIAGFCCYPINPFDLSRKTDLYIKRPTGSIELNYTNYTTNAEVINQPRTIFLHIRFYSLMVALLLVWVFLIESYLYYKMPMWFAVMGMYGVVFLIILYVVIKKYIKAIKDLKKLKEDNDLRIQNI